ncbi:SRPBCC family protein [Undibacterium sp. TS12]|uniref:SRPBCC family protein n=1 Tax=Undibacterium sp. TS12 TaxID=2908202 RepID=UPI001F4C73D9|nr:SRPBCC family protein [Undibacterium sp. TS12]MCH8619275.1 SRPBCC family protein [Undibacterium sp. TS12]
MTDAKAGEGTLDLVLERIVDIPPALVWAAWTTPAHILEWFTPAPWKTVDCEIDLRPGGIFRTVMRSPEGMDHDNVGCYLEVVPGKKLVFTDALGPGFRPTGNSFMTATITFEPHEAGTKYTAVVLHKSVEDRKKHEEMGFHHGWGTALDQLVAHMKGIN